MNCELTKGLLGKQRYGVEIKVHEVPVLKSSHFHILYNLNCLLLRSGYNGTNESATN